MIKRDLLEGPQHYQYTVLLSGGVVASQVAGNFHFAPGKSFQQGSVHVHDLVPFGDTEFDTSHIIDKLSFGVEYPGMTNPLDKARVSKQNTRNPAGRAGAYQYFLKVAACLPACLPVKVACLQCGHRYG